MALPVTEVAAGEEEADKAEVVPTSRPTASPAPATAVAVEEVVAAEVSVVKVAREAEARSVSSLSTRQAQD